MALATDFAGLDSDFLSSVDHDTTGESESNMSKEERENLLYTSQRSSVAVSNAGVSTLSSSRSSLLSLRHFSPKRYWKNLIIVSTAFMFQFSAYSALANLQSSLNENLGTGVASLCAIYVGVFISSLFAPLVIWLLGVKWTMVVCSVFYALYAATNFYPKFYTLIPAAGLLGLAASPHWTAVGTYLTTSSIQLADIIDGVPETLINRFNGIFFCFFQSSQVWGNLISSLVLRNSTPKGNASKCGRHSCGTSVHFNTTDDNTTPGEKEVILISIYIVLGLVATVIFAFLLDKLPNAGRRESQSWKNHLLGHLGSTFRLMKSPYLFLLIPLMIYNGAEQAFISADFTKSFVSCTQGPGLVGYVMIGFGVADAVFSVIFGQIEKYTGRIAIFMFGGLVHLALMIVFEIWEPLDASLWQLILMAVGWGVGDAVWQTQLSSLLGVIFPECQEPAFANFRLWQAVGFAVTYALTIPPVICVYHKLYGLMGFLTLSLLLYITEECLMARPP